MNLTGATGPQKEIITTFDAPFSVAAGAGSGKTFTLTRRILYALVGEEGVQESLIDSIEEVLAITFSRAGAEELRARIRLLLQEEGLDEQAQAVEDAWITTIHGMCARILREHALELGIDPAFEVIEDARRDELWNTALDAVLEDIKTGPLDLRLERLLAWYPESNGSFGSSGLSLFLTETWEKIMGTPEGFEGVIIPAITLDIAATMRTLIELGEQYRSIVATWGDDLGARDKEFFSELEEALDKAYDYQREVDLATALLDDGTFDIDRFLDVVFTFPKTRKDYRTKKPDADFFISYRETYAQIVQEVVTNVSAAVSFDLLRLTQRINAYYQAIKGANALDNADLLRACKQALDDHPELCKAYQKQFKLIVVDEFQDTDLLQVAIIDRLSRDHGSNVTTVGDAQQSIYRFRGADVEVFFAHQDMQRTQHESFKLISMSDNFRSHGDILSFVDTIFSQQAFFGERFLSLDPKGEVHGIPDPLFDTAPRVEVDIVESIGNAKIADARQTVARLIAEHFAMLRGDDEHPRVFDAKPRDMVILLGSMSNAAVYAKELAKVGFESVIAGGSVFAKAKEVQLIDALLTSLADHYNSTAVYIVLESPLFNLSDAAFLALGNPRSQEGERLHISFAEHVWKLISIFKREGEEALITALAIYHLSAEDKRELVRALMLLEQVSKEASHGLLYQGIHQLLVDSGWLYRLQQAGSEGLSAAGNLFKALGFIRDWEREGKTVYAISRSFAEFLAVSKQAPGKLSALDTNYVRIMTIHSSKGLEFGHVAVAEIPDGKAEDSTLSLDLLDGKVLVLLKPQMEKKKRDAYKTLQGYLAEDANDLSLEKTDLQILSPGEFEVFLKERRAMAELADAQRLLYVALTRASKSLFLGLPISGNKNFDYAKKGIIGLLHEVLNWEKSSDETIESFSYGGSAPAKLYHTVLTECSEQEETEEVATSSFEVPTAMMPKLMSAHLETVRANVVSYTSISPDHALESSSTKDTNGDKLLNEEGSIKAYSEETMFAFDEEMFPEDIAALIKHQNATALGTAFHRLAQRLIESREAPGIVPYLPYDAIEAQVAKESLSPEQAQRLTCATERWQNSSLLERFMEYSTIAAEVPFMIELDAGGTPIYLEGEIDGLAFDESDPKHAFFIDYKTGGTDEETAEALYEKHLLQAQCYALALLVQGFETVEANFIRVERASAEDPEQPQVITYQFDSAERLALEAAVVTAYKESAH